MQCALGVVLDEATESALWLEALIHCDLAPDALPLTLLLQDGAADKVCAP
jgi:hypothetical protein